MGTVKTSIGAPNTDPNALLQRSRARLAEQIWWAALILAASSIPLTVWRAVHTGWRFELMWNLCMAAAAILIFFIRDRLGSVIKSSLPVIAIFCLGLLGLIWLGMVGPGYLWIIEGTMLAGTLFSLRIGIALAILSSVLIALAGIGHVSGVLVAHDDAGAYAVNSGAWVNFLLVTTVVPTTILYTIGGFQKTIFELLREVETQRNQLEQLATHDQLTGLPVMRLAEDRLQAACDDARRSGEKVALLFIDLDGFKAVNDTHGHAAGDGVLKEVAARLKTAMRAGDTAARIGGDEFMVILPHLSNGQSATPIARRIVLEISRPIDFSGNLLSIGSSIGIAVFPDHADDIQGLRRLADQTMYRVKRSGKGDFMFVAGS